tara:strand:+ start:42 stop:254 length:213 start_codon:yes stop_codon:yes gene_type:complete
MTAKDKAKELVDRFWELDMLDDNGDLYWIGKENAKQCALICVDEILSQFNWKPSAGLSYWEEVKEEINKL